MPLAIPEVAAAMPAWGFCEPISSPASTSAVVRRFTPWVAATRRAICRWVTWASSWAITAPSSLSLREAVISPLWTPT